MRFPTSYLLPLPQQQTLPGPDSTEVCCHLTRATWTPAAPRSKRVLGAWSGRFSHSSWQMYSRQEIYNDALNTLYRLYILNFSDLLSAMKWVAGVVLGAVFVRTLVLRDPLMVWAVWVWLFTCELRELYCQILSKFDRILTYFDGLILMWIQNPAELASQDNKKHHVDATVHWGGVVWLCMAWHHWPCLNGTPRFVLVPCFKNPMVARKPSL